MWQQLTHKTGLNASSFGKDSVVGVTTHMQLLIQIKALELALIKKKKVLKWQKSNENKMVASFALKWITFGVPQGPIFGLVMFEL